MTIVTGKRNEKRMLDPPALLEPATVFSER
jgi:hypothetical protein